jgi:transposase
MTAIHTHRFQVLTLVLAGQVSRGQAADALGLSPRQVTRLTSRVQEEGPAGLLHRNRGRAPANRLPDALRQEIRLLARTTFAVCNDTHCTELLATEAGIAVSRATVRRVRRADGMAPKRPRRSPRARHRRPRKAAAGLMVQWDGSLHRWFGPEHPACCLMAAIDDATSQVVAAYLLPAESSAGYLTLVRQLATTVGLPHSVYQDRHSALKRNDAHWSLAEQLAGQQTPTQVGDALAELDITPIFARAPQGKGRVERLFGTLQDRLVADFQRAGITTLEDANAALPARLAAFNAQFARPAADPTPVWRPVPEGMDLDRVLAFRYAATVSKDHVIRCNSRTIPVPARPGGRSRAGERVEVRQLLDGRWRVYAGDTLLTETPATDLYEPLRAYTRRAGTPVTYDAQWVPDDTLVALDDLTTAELGEVIQHWRKRRDHGLEATRLA